MRTERDTILEGSVTFFCLANGIYIRPGTPPFLSLLLSITFPNHSRSSHLMTIISHLSHNSFLLWYTQSHPLLSHHSRLRKESPTFTKKLEGTKTCQENLELFFFINHKLLFYSKNKLYYFNKSYKNILF